MDGYAFRAEPGDMTAGENYYYGGLMRFDFTLKPAYHMIDELFNHRWHTKGSAVTGADGKTTIRGFKGDYDVLLEKNGQTVKAACTLSGGKVCLILN